MERFELSGKGRKIKHFISGQTSLIAVLIIFIIGTISYGNIFLNYNRNIINVLHMASLVGIMGVGVNLVFLIGARDLSVGAIGAAASMVAGYLSPYGFLASFIGGLLVGVVFGLINGIVVAKFNVQPFIATLGSQLTARGIALLMNKEYSIDLAPNSHLLKTLGNDNLFGVIPIPTAILLFIIIILSIILKKTNYGRSIYAIGGNEEAAEMMGIRVQMIKISVFLISGVTAALAGIVLAGRLHAGQPTAAIGWEMTIMAAVVIGGTSVRGGSGRISGILFGAIFVQFISNFINLNGKISPYWKDIITGIILLIAVLYQTIYERRKEGVKRSIG